MRIPSASTAATGGGGGSSTPRLTFTADLVTTPRYDRSTTGTASATVANSVIYMRPGATGTSAVTVRDYSGQYLQPVWDKNPMFWASWMGGNYRAGNSWDTYVSMDGVIDAATAPNGKYMGFKTTNRSGTKTLYTVHCDGTNPEVATAITGISFSNDEIVSSAVMTSGSKIEFYFNGVLKATHTTNLPTGSMTANSLYGVGLYGISGTDNDIGLSISLVGASYDAY